MQMGRRLVFLMLRTFCRFIFRMQMRFMVCTVRTVVLLGDSRRGCLAGVFWIFIVFKSFSRIIIVCFWGFVFFVQFWFVWGRLQGIILFLAFVLFLIGFFEFFLNVEFLVVGAMVRRSRRIWLLLCSLRFLGICRRRRVEVLVIV